jgi:DNA-binding GntR family transcriptional regulator
VNVTFCAKRKGENPIKETLKDVAYNYLYEKIVSYEFPAGTAIVEQEISDAIKISRTPIREALKQLAAEGLVYNLPGRGTFVQDLYTQDIEEIFELRKLFEESSLKFAITEITDEEIDEIEKMIIVLEESSSAEEFFKSDQALHNLIVKYSHNGRMISFHRNINAQLERLRRISIKNQKRLEKSKQEHLELIRAIKERNLEKATSCLCNHLRGIKESIIEEHRRLRLLRKY